MPLHVALTHKTSYSYDHAIALGPQTIRLRPAPHARTPIISYGLTISPKPHFLNWQQDPQGNFLARVVFPERVTHFDVTVDLVADMATINPFDFFLEPEAETFPFTYDPVLEQELAPFRRAAPAGAHLQKLIDAVPLALAACTPADGGAPRTIDVLVALNRIVQESVAYIVRLEPGVWDPEETLGHAKGSCRDSAWVLVQLLRHLGYAARFCSGYLIQLVADEVPLDGPAGPTSDFTDLHAWAEVYLPGAGWIGLDATSGLMSGEGHIPLASTPEPQSAAPISGLVEKAEVTFGFEMTVTRVRETPRTTKPYSERVWQDIQAAGRRVDAALERSGVRMTMGGEPTFVSASDIEAAEWNTDAMGPTKRRMGGRLMRRLAPLWAPGAALHYGMGKLYPGEQLPRWTLSAHWRLDGEPVWTDPTLLASDDDTGTATPEDAAHFAAILAERLQIDPALVIPAHEDIHYYLWREQRLPANVVVEDAKLRDPLERARLAHVFGQGLASAVGSVLPLRRVIAEGQRRWQSGPWFLRDTDGKASPLFLVPGDSPIGLRLPLESLAWAKDSTLAMQADQERDPFAPVEPLASRQMIRDRVATRGLSPAFRPSAQALPEVGKEDPDVVRTALAVEPRGGLIHVFCPPLTAAEDWLELVAAIEATAAEMGQKIFLEGYLPPSDDRMQDFSVTPDPGVIEVNIHPVSSFAEQVERTEQLYEEARQIGLATQKFMQDGRHVGTGGGNHVVMGGATVAESPFLRRPDLLKSLVGFFQNHPSLSFLFSGLFIGPTSQHPRVDEARMDTLNELEIAFSRIKPGQDAPPWMVDRLFRHLLADMTGNTHRTEFCIDKMYSPDGPGGRRGLVEFRAFEMPPHAQMSAAQMLLMRSAVAAFWQRPWDRRLVRWGTRLHDEFLLPHYCMADFNDAMAELTSLGAPIDPAWFAPHAEFRFPLVGETTIRDVHLELRSALEPWHVLPEEASATGTVRYVDSSAERLQVKAQGFIPERHILAVNGRAVPLWATETAGEFVAGVRFKAWSPPSSLHPTIAAQTPLVFDLYDRWTGRSLGGMAHHVVHPGGRSYEDFPVNANAAEARRRSRFFPFGHTPGPMPEPRSVAGSEHPRTLDLRRGA